MNPVLHAFLEFMDGLSGISLVHFKPMEHMTDSKRLAITEILRPHFQDLLREFEMPYDRALPVLQYYQVRERPTALLFLEEPPGTVIKGYHTIRSYLRKQEDNY